ncbi:ras-related and estrogen-regulated growth inhibitor [Lingula anatina]|uniref:small monomeric GTPase n=1 Tax=Lingula anatina TaxID=7574 RepID=A0A2R2MT36_LINAN|nr:ras-related and estrogen-regulated growth inhibitor [Lingula anatina]|eukprot:XP_023933416.1 ras-related and estrogen-regulated growth inhibitor [Lingula anatina]
MAGGEENGRLTSGGRDMNILVLGMDGVGKTALIVRYITKRYIGDYDPYSEAMYTSNSVIDGKPVTLRVIDTVGLEKNSKRSEQITWADGFVLVFSLTCRKSFEAVKRIKEHINELRQDTKIPMILVGNKADLSHARAVKPVETRGLATDLQCQMFETSASDNYGSVVNAFHALYREVRTVLKQREKVKKVMQKPGISKKLQIANALRNLREFRIRTYTV